MPFSTVFNVWNARTSKANIDKSLAELQQQFDSHPFATAGSLEHRKLEYLSNLITEWMGINGLHSDTPVRGCQECSLSLNNLFQYTMTAGPDCKPAGCCDRHLTERFPSIFYNCE